jgi:hypothetical protein
MCCACTVVYVLGMFFSGASLVNLQLVGNPINMFTTSVVYQASGSDTELYRSPRYFT